MSMQHIAVIGAGTMGNGIAQVCAIAGFDVTLLDINDAALERGLATVRKNLERQVNKQTLTVDLAEEALGRIRCITDYAQLNEPQVVIEAATENLDLKLRLLKQIAANVGTDCVIASNTSSLSITQLAASVDSPERFLGLHFFNPVPMMGLIEVIRGLQTADETHVVAIKLAERLNKTAITAGNRPGFVVNRILVPMINEAILVLQEGLATAQDIDAGMRLGCNQPIGPLALADLIPCWPSSKPSMRASTTANTALLHCSRKWLQRGIWVARAGVGSSFTTESSLRARIGGAAVRLAGCHRVSASPPIHKKKPQPFTGCGFFASGAYQWENSEFPTLPAIFSGLIRKRASAGSSHRAPNMFHSSMKVSMSPMSAWNLMAEKIQVQTPIARHSPVNSTALPVDFSVS
jgi:3-hydroxybutyryl-CoA dehydrogenase